MAAFSASVEEEEPEEEEEEPGLKTRSEATLAAVLMGHSLAASEATETAVAPGEVDATDSYSLPERKYWEENQQ